MPFGLRNAPASVQRLMNLLTEGMENCATYIYDICLYNDDWLFRLVNITEFLGKIKQAGSTVNLPKCEFGKTQITYLGFTVGQGEVRPKLGNVRAILDFPLSV